MITAPMLTLDRERIAIEQAMTRQAELMLSMLNATLPVLVRPHVVLKAKDDSASTDAKRYIYMPATFSGIDVLSPAFHWARTALLAHELSHWLQPCAEIDRVTETTGLNSNFVNVVMDIQGEALIASLLPYYNEHLTRLRWHVGKTNRQSYLTALKKPESGDDYFLQNAMTLSLLGRYVLDRSSSFYAEDQLDRTDVRKAHGKRWPYDPASRASERMSALLVTMNSAVMLRANDLPTLLGEIAMDYPELCQQEGSPFSVLGHGGYLPAELQELLKKFAEQEVERPQISFWEGDALGVRPATPEERRRANAMKLHFSTPKGAIEIMAPGRFDRMAALSGSPMPWTMEIRQDTGTSEMSDVVVAVDISGSMGGEKWAKAISAARSITLAVQAAGGDVRGLVFDENVWYARDYDSKLFFATSVAGLSLLEAHGWTSFEWLPYLWQQYPNHRVVIITDGGRLSDLAGIAHIPTRQRACTGAIVIPAGNAENMTHVAANVIEVSNLDLLAGAMTSVLPRRTM